MIPLLHLLLKYNLANLKKSKKMVFTLKELNELYYALLVADKHGNFTNHDVNQNLQNKIKEVINNFHLNEEE